MGVLTTWFQGGDNGNLNRSTSPIKKRKKNGVFWLLHEQIPSQVKLSIKYIVIENFGIRCCGNPVNPRKHKHKNIIFIQYIEHIWGILLCMIYVKVLQIFFLKVFWLLSNRGMEGVVKIGHH